MEDTPTVIMSDEKSLEDFFAKKDKSKKNKSKAKAKGKTKFMTTDEIAKNLCRDVDVKKTSKQQDRDREARDKKEKEKKAVSAAAVAEQTATEVGEEKPIINKQPAFPIGEAEEWNEFEDPTQKDYSGLKVQSLQISAEPEDNADEDEEGELEMDENGDMVKKKDSGASGPWNKSGGAGTEKPVAAPSKPEPPVVQEVIKPEALKNVTGGKYVPPSRRNAPEGERSTPARTANRNKGGRHAPSIQSDLDFPSLAASSDIAKYSDKNDDKNYREVKRGGQATDNPAGHKSGLELGNRYSALGNN